MRCRRSTGPGFISSKDGELVVGPFQGKPACVRIALGKGVCGTAAAERRDAGGAGRAAFPGHIACDAASRSEIVVPLISGASCWACSTSTARASAASTTATRAGSSGWRRCSWTRASPARAQPAADDAGAARRTRGLAAGVAGVRRSGALFPLYLHAAGDGPGAADDRASHRLVVPVHLPVDARARRARQPAAASSPARPCWRGWRLRRC